MPGGIASIDTSFPDLSGKSEREQVQTLVSYLYTLLENLRYILGNLGEENINDAEYKKITNAAVFTALGEEGATVINGGNISTGTINANLIKAGELSGITIRGVDIYGAKYHDEDGDCVLDLTSTNANYNLLFGTGNLTGANFAFGIHYDPVNGPSIMYLGNREILRASPWGPAVYASGEWVFDSDISLPANSTYPTTTEVQAMIDASLADYYTKTEADARFEPITP